MSTNKNNQESIFETNRINKSLKDSPDFQNNKKEVKLPNLKNILPKKSSIPSHYNKEK